MLRIHVIASPSVLPGWLCGWEGLEEPKGIRGPSLMATPMYRGKIRTRWNYGDSRKAPTCSN